MSEGELSTVIELGPRRKPASAAALTEARIKAAVPRAALYYLKDAAVPGLTVRVTPNGAKAYVLRSRIGTGRGAPRIDYKLGTPAEMPLAQARQAARETLVLLRKGTDPRLSAPGSALVKDVLDRYERSLEARGVVKRRDIMSSLRRNLGKFRYAAIGDLTRLSLVSVIDEIELAGKPGAAQYFRAKATAFLNFAADKGYIPASPLAGFRRERLTRSQRAIRPRAAYPTREELQGLLRAFWSLSDPIFRDLLRLGLLTGQRRGEIASLRWSDLDLSDPKNPRWIIPAGLRKTGEAHTVPLGALSVALLKAQPRLAESSLVFPSRRPTRPISGWTQRLVEVREALGDKRFSMHALRRSYRSGLTEIGVDFDTAELQIGHKRPGLAGTYDKSEVWTKRQAAQAAWETLICDVEGKLKAYTN